MKTINFQNKTSRILKLESYVGIKEVIALKKALLKMDGCREIIIDLSEVIYIDDEFIDALKSFRIMRFESSGRVVLVNPSEIVKRILELGQVPQLYRVQHIHSTVW
jgi:anti-anti-sigma regulatory factor